MKKEIFVKRLKRRIRVISTIGWGRECPICQWKGGRFLSFDGQKEVLCPKCWSHNRHRFHHLILKNLNLSLCKTLHFAPEPCMQLMLKKSKQYVTCDLSSKNAGLSCDITKLPFNDGSFDFIYCSHVLEHVQDVEKAIIELRRILSEDGMALVAVPLWPGRTTKKYFELGPYGHWWQPGEGWFSKYSAEGFYTKIFDPAHYAVNKFGLLKDWDRCALLSKNSHTKVA